MNEDLVDLIRTAMEHRSAITNELATYYEENTSHEPLTTFEMSLVEEGVTQATLKALRAPDDIEDGELFTELERRGFVRCYRPYLTDLGRAILEIFGTL